MSNSYKTWNDVNDLVTLKLIDSYVELFLFIIVSYHTFWGSFGH